MSGKLSQPPPPPADWKAQTKAGGGDGGGVPRSWAASRRKGTKEPGPQTETTRVC